MAPKTPTPKQNVPAKRRPITASEKQLWAELVQTLVIAGLVEHSRWSGRQAVFHGGTSLKLGWGSPRFSEDLDFLLKRDLLGAARQHMQGAVDHARANLARIDASLTLELVGSESGRMARYEVRLTKPGVIGKAAVKAEFWGVEERYLEQYVSTPRQPQLSQDLASAGYVVRVRSMLPMATLDSVYYDKLVAAVARPYVKWRDIFDIWWVQNERDFRREESDIVAQKVLAHAAAYDIAPNSDAETPTGLKFDTERELAGYMAAKLRSWAELIEQPEMKDRAQTELKRFLSDAAGSSHLWEMYWPDKVAEMIQVAAASARACAGGMDTIADVTAARPSDRSRSTDVPRG